EFRRVLFRSEFLELAPTAAFRYAAKTGHALRHICLEADAALLAVIADVDAGFHLLCNDMVNRLVHLRSQNFRVVVLALLLRHQQLGEPFIARQTADMGGENTVPAGDHERGSFSPVIAAFRSSLHNT